MGVDFKRWIGDALLGVSGLDKVFGLRMGMNLSQLAEVVNLSPVPGADCLYSTVRLPQGWTEFDSYALLVSPTLGLCKVVAETPAVYGDPTGKQLRQLFNVLAARINRRGSVGHRYDVHQRYSVLEGSEHWLTALHWGHSALAEVWSGSGLVGMDFVRAAALRAKSLGPSSGSVELMVELSNFKAAHTEPNVPNVAFSDHQTTAEGQLLAA
jgi:hypothetical protein